MNYHELYTPQMGERLRLQSEFRPRCDGASWIRIVATREVREGDDRYIWRSPLMCPEMLQLVRRVSATQPLAALLRGGPHDGAAFLVAQLPDVMWTQTIQNGDTHSDFINVYTPTPSRPAPAGGKFSAYRMAGLYRGGFLYLFDPTVR